MLVRLRHRSNEAKAPAIAGEDAPELEGPRRLSHREFLKTLGVAIGLAGAGALALENNKAEATYIPGPPDVVNTNLQVQGTLTADGNLGVGTTSPGPLGDGDNPKSLQVLGSGTNSYGLLTLSTNQTGDGRTVGAISFGSTGLSNGDKRIGGIYSIKKDASTTAGKGNLEFYVWNAGAPVNALTMQYDGKVGIGAPSPASMGDGDNPKLVQVLGSGTAAYGLLTLATDQTGSGRTVGGISFGSTGLSNGDKRTAGIYSIKKDGSATGGTGNLEFYVWNAGAPIDALTIQYNGNVGIGVPVPTAQLDLSNGPIKVNGTVAIDTSGTATKSYYAP